MPITKVFYNQGLNVTQPTLEVLAKAIETMLLEGLKAPPSVTGEVIFIPVPLIHYGKDLYIEVDCRQEGYYVAATLNQLAANIEKLVKDKMGTNHNCKVRMLAFSNEQIYWYD